MSKVEVKNDKDIFQLDAINKIGYLYYKGKYYVINMLDGDLQHNAQNLDDNIDFCLVYDNGHFDVFVNDEEVKFELTKGNIDDYFEK